MGSSPTKPNGNTSTASSRPDGKPTIRISHAKAKLKTKVAVIASFQSQPNRPGTQLKPNRPATQLHAQPPPRRSSRKELLEFVSKRKSEMKELWTEMEQDEPAKESDTESTSVGKLSRQTSEYTDQQLSDAMDDSQGVCAVCKRMAVYDGYPCRVCDRVYHQACLETRDTHQDQLTRTLAYARTKLGWSCHQCEDTSKLLNDEELSEIIDSFDKYGVSQAAGITWDTFLAYHKFRENRLDPVDIDYLRTQYRLLDLDGSGHISWYEFLVHEAGIKLSYRSPESLVELLSPKETARARDTFKYLDRDGDGFVTEGEVRGAYRGWYSRIDPAVRRQERRVSLATVVSDLVVQRADREPTVLQMHVDNASKILMDGANNHGSLSWYDYLCSQALYILCLRPNRILPGTLKS